MAESEFGRLNLVKSESLREIVGGNPFLFFPENEKDWEPKTGLFSKGKSEGEKGHA